MKRFQFLLLLSVILILAAGCGTTIALFDQYAYTQATAIKVDALTVMDYSKDNYQEHENDIKQVDLKFREMIEYEKHRPQDTINTKMWLTMYDHNKRLYGGFINRWKEKGKLDTGFINDQKVSVGRAFDDIIDLEAKKIKK